MPIDFLKAKQKLEEEQFEKNLTKLLKENFSWIDLNETTSLQIYENFTYIWNKFKKQVIKDLASSLNLDKDKLLWAIYIERLLKNLAKNLEILHNWYITSYLEKYESTKNPYFLQLWGDVALIRSSIFPGKMKMIRQKDYIKLGKTMYYARYNETEKEIWKILAKNLDFFAEELIKTFEK